ncbi:MAG: hypothetical protein H6854_02025 [Rhodospirillales bacterium]|nr:hypothetical protein [Rhodospirillales bacterium]
MRDNQKKTYTNKQVAAIIARGNDPQEIERLARQVRYWTTEDILSPIGGKHSGTGRHREYGIQEVYKAALTYELMRHGVSVITLLPWAEYIGSQINIYNWEHLISEQKNMLLMYSKDCSDHNRNLFTIVDHQQNPLSYLQAWQDEGNLVDPMDYPTVIIINLTKLFARLEV